VGFTLGAVEQRVSLVTLGVSDYARAKAFYEALGWSARLVIEETAFFETNGCILVLWARDKLAEDSGISDDGGSWGGIALAQAPREPC
jgi:catechol 2,3-dioxygenase-like lactoylglutathione lyase family enzyme